MRSKSTLRLTARSDLKGRIDLGPVLDLNEYSHQIGKWHVSFSTWFKRWYFIWSQISQKSITHNRPTSQTSVLQFCHTGVVSNCLFKYHLSIGIIARHLESWSEGNLTNNQKTGFENQYGYRDQERQKSAFKTALKSRLTWWTTFHRFPLSTFEQSCT